METQEFMEKFNARCAEIGADIRLAPMPEYEPKDGDRLTPLRITERVSCVYGEGHAQIIAEARAPAAIADGLTAFCAAIDALLPVSTEVRNGYLRRLNLFNGRLSPSGAQTTARGYTLSVRPNNPSPGLVSYIIQKNR